MSGRKIFHGRLYLKREGFKLSICNKDQTIDRVEKFKEAAYIRLQISV